MPFLAPLFFVALAGLAIPVLLHLTQREKKQVQRFPSLMFVRRIPYQSVRRRQDPATGCCCCVRLAALALIILAFARPLLAARRRAVPLGQGAREARGAARHQLQHGLRRSVGAGARGGATTRSAS